MSEKPVILAEPCNWSFDNVAEDFESHIQQSVPNYHAGHELICRFSDFMLRDDSLVYDIGCSTGTLAKKFLNWNQQRSNLQYVGIDASVNQIEVANRENISDPRFKTYCDDVVNHPFEPCTVAVSYYTLQFVRPAYRQALIDQIYASLEWGGALFLFEKVRGPDARFQDYASQIYQDIKHSSGFSEVEILNKSKSLKGVLEPFSTAGNMGLLGRAGFVDIMSVYKWVCFEGWLAIK
ncbi:MAG: tRNA (cmo5U34)-methyltransferase [Parasphingorhabdus sp.]|jgi:tRNA (cmo5U34)-methyltransferase